MRTETPPELNAVGEIIKPKLCCLLFVYVVLKITVSKLYILLTLQVV